METYWVTGVNNLGKFGRWPFAEFTQVYRVEAEFNKVIEQSLSKKADSHAGDTI